VSKLVDISVSKLVDISVSKLVEIRYITCGKPLVPGLYSNTPHPTSVTTYYL